MPETPNQHTRDYSDSPDGADAPARKRSGVNIEKIAADPTKRLEIADKLLPGLYLIIQPSGHRSWAIRYRSPATGRSRKLTLGTYPQFTQAEARKRARELMQDVSAGRDPADAEAEPAAAPVVGFRHIAELYVERYCRTHQRSWRATERSLRKDVLPVWGDRAFDSISRADVNALLHAIVDRGTGVQANRTLAHIRALYNWAVDEGYIEHSPAQRVRRKAPETPRDRWLKDEEIRALWAAWTRQGWPWGPAQKLLLLTGLRRDEVFEAAWSEIDLGNLLWTIPKQRMKNKQEHYVELSGAVMDILQTLPRFESPWLFPATRQYQQRASLSRPMSGTSHARKQLDRLLAEAGVTLPDWRWHDLRRTCRTNLARLGIPDAVAEAVIGHLPARLIATYSRWTYREEKRDAMERWAELVADIVEDRPARNVRRLRG